ESPDSCLVDRTPDHAQERQWISPSRPRETDRGAGSQKIVRARCLTIANDAVILNCARCRVSGQRMYAEPQSPPLGRYRLIALLGQGGMADVFLACTQGPGGFQKLLVVKLARFTGDPTFATMLLEEARIAAQLEHPNIVQTYEIAEDGSRRYIVMEYL